MAVVRSKKEGEERVDDPLIVEEARVGLARAPQLGEELFVGMTFKGLRYGEGGFSGDLVLTVELAEHLAELLSEATAKARRARQ